MRYFEYLEPNSQDEVHYVIMTEDQILTGPWAEHCRNMNRRFNEVNLKYGFQLNFLSDEEVIEEFIIVNWAQEIIGEA